MILWNTADKATKRWYIYRMLNLFGREAVAKMEELDRVASCTSLTILLDHDIPESERAQWAEEEKAQKLGVEGYLY